METLLRTPLLGGGVADVENKLPWKYLGASDLANTEYVANFPIPEGTNELSVHCGNKNGGQVFMGESVHIPIASAGGHPISCPVFNVNGTLDKLIYVFLNTPTSLQFRMYVNNEGNPGRVVVYYR